jgi:hypothetical protein
LEGIQIIVCCNDKFGMIYMIHHQILIEDVVASVERNTDFLSRHLSYDDQSAQHLALLSHSAVSPSRNP